jgi:hypothetical protein
MSMLAGGRAGVGQFPAKFTFDVTAAPDCTNDFVAYNSSFAGVAPTGAATRNGTFTAVSTGGTVTIRSTEATLVLTASTTTNTGLNFQAITNVTVEAANLAAAINRNNFATLGSGHVKVLASSAAGTVTVTASKDGVTPLDGQEGNNTTLAQAIAPAATFTWASGTLTGGAGRGNIVAFHNLYSTQGAAGGLCNQDGALVYWSYFTGTGTDVTSVVISGDGTKVAYVEDVAGAATLRILKWKAGEGAGTGYPSAVDQNISGAAWSTCTTGNSCVASIAFNGAPNDTRSAPYYDYFTDAIYVGDNGGRMHKFVGVFLAAPTECLAGVVTVCGTAAQAAAWPITVNAGTILTSPVYDGVSGNIFVGDSTGRLSFIRETGSAQGTCAPQPCLDATHLAVGTGGSIVDAPIVDGTNQTVFAVNGTETSANHGTIVQASTALASLASFAIGGSAAGGQPIYSGTFDNTYFNSAKPSVSGHMYVCGKDPATNNRPGLYQLSFNGAGTLTGVGIPLVGFANANSVACSPVTEFNNPNGGGAGIARDWIFFSIGNSANSVNPIPLGSACRTNNAGCVMSVDVTGGPAWPPVAVTASAPTPGNNPGSTSGIVVDNTSTSAQASSFYFSFGSNSVGAGPGVPSCNTTAGRGCAVKLTQSALN